ncbi:MAG: TatD family hydrolase [Polyangiales bacterium]
MPAPLFDTHCHLSFESFGPEVDAILDRARASGVKRFVTIGSGEGTKSAVSAVAMAEKLVPEVWATVGVHPHDATELDDAAKALLESLATREHVVAIGETGLDYHYDHSPREKQADAFRYQIDLARRVKKPIVIHTRTAAEDTLRILREENARDVGGIIHCFSEDAAFAKASLDLGFVSSFSGIVTFPRGTEGIRDAAKNQPADAILIETDAPYLAPVPHRGKRNEPAYVAHTADFLAGLRGEDPEEFRARTTQNGCRIFGVPAPAEAK